MIPRMYEIVSLEAVGIACAICEIPIFISLKFIAFDWVLWNLSIYELMWAIIHNF